MAAPIRNKKLPNYKFIMKGEKVILIDPVFYYGRNVGHGNYMAGQRSDNKELLTDNAGKPYTYTAINLPNWEN